MYCQDNIEDSETQQENNEESEENNNITLLVPEYEFIVSSALVEEIDVAELHSDSIEVDAPSNIINGSFEEPVVYNTTTNGYKLENWANVPGWRTTEKTNMIEFGWVKADGKSRHMTEEIVSSEEPKAYEGNQFLELVATEANGTVFQVVPANNGEFCNWSLAHRGRYTLDTAILILGQDQGIDYNKTNASDNDHLNQMVQWFRENSGFTAANGLQTKYIIYSAPFTDNGAFSGVAEGESPFSASYDTVHTQKWVLNTVSSDNSKWNEFSGTLVNDFASGNMFVGLVYYESIGSPNESSGNLIDSVNVNFGGENLISNSSFESPTTTTAGYIKANAANSAKPAANVGWSITTIEKILEFGNLANGKNSYKLPNTNVYKSKVYVRDGKQFAELNANEESSLYQIVTTESNKMYRWSLSHRGRYATDKMALIIGPNQTYAPMKQTSNSRDQLMQIVDWVKAQTQYPIIINENQSTQCIEVWTSKFDDNGGFITENPFSWTSDDEHTERWNLWIICSDEELWHDYGAIDADRDYSCEYIVPENSSQSIFGFVSFESTPPEETGGKPNESFGNLIDNVSFFEYYKVTVINSSNNGGSSGYIVSPNDDFLYDDPANGWALAGSQIVIVVTEGTRPFIGGIVNGVFVPASDWEFNESSGQWVYKYNVPEIHGAMVVQLVYSAHNVVYDSNGGLPYDYNGEGSGDEVPLSIVDNSYTSHEATPAMDGQRFIAWKYTHTDSVSYLLQAIHNLRFVGGDGTNDVITISGNDIYGNEVSINDISADYGATLYGQWEYRYRFIATTLDINDNEYHINNEGGTVTILSSGSYTADDYLYENETVGKEIWAENDNTQIRFVATAKSGYLFKGWYDSDGKLLSSNPSYFKLTYTNKPIDIYAHFEPVGLTLTVRKMVSGNISDKSKYFEIQIHLSNLSKNTAYLITDAPTVQLKQDGSTSSNPTAFVSNENGEASIILYLKDSTYANIVNLPSGTVYSVDEKDYSLNGYTTEGEVSDTTLTEDSEVIIINTSQLNVPTGIEENISPYIVMITVSVFFIAFIYFKRRKAAEELWM